MTRGWRDERRLPRGLLMQVALLWLLLPAASVSGKVPGNTASRSAVLQDGGSVRAGRLCAPVSPAVVVDQAPIGTNACGPCAIYAALANGREGLRLSAAGLRGDSHQGRVRDLIAVHGQRPSAVYQGRRPRYLAAQGMAVEDLARFVAEAAGETLSKPPHGDYADRQQGESRPDHLRRMHARLRCSLEAGFPPIVDVRSFAVRPSEGEGPPRWFGLLGHMIAVLEVQDQLEPGATSFAFRFADSETGRVEIAHAHVDEAQNFTATRRFSVDQAGANQWEWVSDHPYLLVRGSSLHLNTNREPWHARTTVVMRFSLVDGATATPR